MRRLGWLALAALAGAPGAAAHEVRPAFLQIDQTGPARYDVTWKQPSLGDRAVHLQPHLSNGWLEAPPDEAFAADGFLIRHWTVRSAAPLEGATLEIEGLADTITDALVRVRATDGHAQELILRPEAPRARLALSGGGPSGLTAFFGLGVQHILSGADHLLFILGLLLIVRDRWMLLKTLTAFTVAHSLTLGLATLGVLRLPAPLLNALIALSILAVAVEAMRARAGAVTLTSRRPWMIAFGFGLLHGMGFAGGLSALGLDRGALLPALGVFNLGVEAGQLAFLALVLALRRAFHLMQIRWPPAVEAMPAYVVGTLGAMWTLQYGALALGLG